FPATVTRMESRKRWMLAGLSVKGSIVVDSGAAKVLREARRSLLPAGVQDVRGPFQRGEAVAVLDSDGRRIACGIANYASEEIMRIDRKSTRLNSSHVAISYAVFCLKKKKQ